ncbi:MAG: hypothetical protein U1E25_13775 [Methylocystis sp.]
MSDEWSYQVRVNLADEAAKLARKDPDNSRLQPLRDILSRHNAKLRNQLDAFSDYVAAAEREGQQDFPLYKWTKAVIEDPAKIEKHSKAFSIHVGGAEVYDKEVADALEAEIRPLVGGPLVTRLTKHDSNPANNPQAPAQYR